MIMAESQPRFDPDSILCVFQLEPSKEANRNPFPQFDPDAAKETCGILFESTAMPTGPNFPLVDT